MATEQITYTSNTHGHIYGNSATYSTASNTPSGELGGFTIGQKTGFYIYRSYIGFDTSVIPNDANITRAYIKAYALRNNSIDDFDVELIKQDFVFPLTSDTTTKYNDALTSDKDVTLFNTNILINVSTDYQFTSPDLDTTWINKTGSTNYSIVSANDRSNTEPTGDEFIFIREVESIDLFVETETSLVISGGLHKITGINKLIW